MSKWTGVVFLNFDVGLDLDESPVMCNGCYSLCRIRLIKTIYDFYKE